MGTIVNPVLNWLGSGCVQTESWALQEKQNLQQYIGNTCHWQGIEERRYIGHRIAIVLFPAQGPSLREGTTFG